MSQVSAPEKNSVPLHAPACVSAKTLLAIALTCGLTACASFTDKDPARTSHNLPEQGRQAARDNLLSDALAALAKGDSERSIALAQNMVMNDIRSAPAHLILAAGYHLSGGQPSLELAGSGYKTASQFAGQGYWSDYLSGVVAIQRHQEMQALEHFAAAALNAPDNAFVFEGLAAAAYLTGHLSLAEAAAQRTRKLSPDSRIGWQLSTLIKAAQGQPQMVQQLIDQAPKSVGAEQRQWVTSRAANLIRTVNLETTDRAANPRLTGTITAQLQIGPAATQGQQGNLRPIDQQAELPAVQPSVQPGADQQLTVDVTVILSDDRSTSAYGVNLLDGLQGIYSFAKGSQTIYANTGDSSQTTITRAIRTPDITYNLNIFNRGNRSYEAIARPSLTAFVGEPSTFFIGEQLIVNLAGIQSAQLEKIDVGVSLKITPADIRPDGSRFRVEVDRGFFSEQSTGSFKEAVSTFKQSVAATADVKFGETLILSGLSETVTDGANSRTPILGDIPVVDTLFSRTTKLKRTRSAIILVTPSQAGFVNRTVNRSEKIERLTRLWDSVIEPRVGAPSLYENYKSGPTFTRPATGDVNVRDLQDQALRARLVEDVRRMAQTL